MYKINEKPVSVNAMRKGRTFLTTEYKRFKRDAVLELLSQKPKKVLGKTLEVTLIFYLKDLYKCDIDNLAKSTIDSCTEAGLWEDDRYITTLTLIKEKANKDSVSIIVI